MRNGSGTGAKKVKKHLDKRVADAYNVIWLEKTNYFLKMLVS